MLPGQPLTMDDVMCETAIAYPGNLTAEHDRQPDQDILEDVCDNLFNADPYYQQGGDMVRVGGMTYACTPPETISGAGFPTWKIDNSGDRSQPARATG